LHHSKQNTLNQARKEKLIQNFSNENLGERIHLRQLWVQERTTLKQFQIHKVPEYVKVKVKESLTSLVWPREFQEF